MELPCEICAVKTPPKSKLIEIGGRCFMRSASVLFDTALGKGSIPGIEDCIGSDVAAFYRFGQTLKERLGVLGALNMGRCIKEYPDVLSLDSSVRVFHVA
jgi:hypothetical protein